MHLFVFVHSIVTYFTVLNWTKYSVTVTYTHNFQCLQYWLRGRVQAFQVWKHDFDLWVAGDGLDMYQQLEGGFGSMRASERKMGQKQET